MPVRLQDALIRLTASKTMQSISIAELCREAGVSRSTFYLHYAHIKEVFDDVVRRMMEVVQPFYEKTGCKECLNGGGVVFCDFIRTRPEWKGIVSDRDFLSTWIDLSVAQSDYDYLEMLRRRGVPKRQAEVLLTFHMSGCYAVAVSAYAKDADFDQYRRMLDKFIRAGHDAVCPRP